eukprot:CAMPEP_0197656132 /NCGR_PEP_ID=MMETSP1338-20131121/40403_1 /TAXON_ID=43686 ORGANISM="Pelagodinium beii, Strain RCC1491" /NCGR_SAMPLE_ID=MMETSP1338 /ASSEMBLY_ACC=CAM_ASM_000754 /LENGTH=274 /DNA_ID=CAMNT_0043231973 /DNA_START=47 /DNA_END=867 /DNA_ORIENTATION=+
MAGWTGSRRSLGARLTWLLLLAAAVSVLPGLTMSGPDSRGSQAHGDQQLEKALDAALSKVEKLRREVDSKRIIASFGKKAYAILQGVKESGSADLEAAVDGSLHALFLRQLSLVQERLTQKFLHSRSARAALARADEAFVKAAEDLLCPESSWSIESARQAFYADFGDALRREVVLAQERSHAEQTQRATADVIGKIQKQMEQISEKLRGSGGPWSLWTSYRLPGTPIQVSGRYTDGRANVQLDLSSNQDPANAEAGFVEGLTPANLGLSLNIG